MTLYLAVSDSYYRLRWSAPPKHLVDNDTEPYRGMRSHSLCGQDVNVWDDRYNPDKSTPRVCKTCLKLKEQRGLPA